MTTLTIGEPIPATVILQADPGGEIVERREPRGLATRLVDRDGIVLVAVARRGAVREERGLGACIRIAGRSVLEASIIVPRGDSAKDRKELDAWAPSRMVSTPLGLIPWGVETWDAFCHPYSGALRQTCYTARGPLVAAGMGRTISLLSDTWRPAHGRFEGGWTFYPAGWDETVVDDRGRQRLRSVSPHLPPIRVKALGEMGEMVEFARPPGGPGYGKRNADGSHWRGMFVDLIPLAFTFDGIERRQISEHLEAFGLPPLGLPAALPIDVESAEHLANLVEAMHKLAVLLDDEAARWLTSAGRQRLGQSVLDITRLRPGVLAAELLRASGIRPPGAVHDVPKQILDAAIGANHGGWLSAEAVGRDE